MPPFCRPPAATATTGATSPWAAGGAASSPAAKAPSQEKSEAAATAHYLANAGVLVVAGDTRVAFDPIFSRDFGEYQRLLAERPEIHLYAPEQAVAIMREREARPGTLARITGIRLAPDGPA